jgi:hypothetical protein
MLAPHSKVPPALVEAVGRAQALGICSGLGEAVSATETHVVRLRGTEGPAPGRRRRSGR